MNNKKNLLYRIGAFMLLFFNMIAVYAPPSTPGGTPPPGCWPPPCIPIDSGISLLIAAGIAFGAKRSFDHLKGKKN